MNWLYRLPRRDQIALLLLLLSLLAYCLWFGVVATLQRQSEQQQQRTGRQRPPRPTRAL